MATSIVATVHFAPTEKAQRRATEPRGWEFGHQLPVADVGRLIEKGYCLAVRRLGLFALGLCTPLPDTKNSSYSLAFLSPSTVGPVWWNSRRPAGFRPF